MNIYILALALSGLIAASAIPASAQQYHREYGGSRVVMQSQTGLYMPSSTYIGAGTLSRSAQGKGPGVGGALPAVNMGSTVRTPGDNLYNNDGTDRTDNGSLIYQDQERAMMMAQFRRQQAAVRRAKILEMRQGQTARGTLYIPGQNTGTATYGAPSNAGIFYHGNGAAGYGDEKHATRQF